MPPVEAVVNLVNLLPPLIINRKRFILGELERDLLTGYQRPRNSASNLMRDALCPAVN